MTLVEMDGEHTSVEVAFSVVVAWFIVLMLVGAYGPIVLAEND